MKFQDVMNCLNRKLLFFIAFQSIHTHTHKTKNKKNERRKKREKRKFFKKERQESDSVQARQDHGEFGSPFL